MKKMKKTSAIIIIILSSMLIIAMPKVLNSENLSFDNEKAMPFNHGWTYQTRENQQKEIVLPVKLDIDTGTDCILTNTFPNTLVPGAAICIFTTGQSIRIIVENQILYEHGEDCSKYLGRTPGSSWNIIRIPETYAGKEFQMQIQAPYQTYSGDIDGVLYGSKSAILFEIIRDHGFGFVVAIITLLMGMGLFFLYWILREDVYRNNSLLYLSLFTICLSLWLIGESQMLQFITGNYVIVVNLTYLALMVFPMPYLLFHRTSFEHKLKDWSHVLFIAFFVNFIVVVGLTVLGISDFYQMLPTTHFLIFLGMIYIVASLIMEILYSGNDIAKSQLIPIGILVFCGLFELFYFYCIDEKRVTDFFGMGLPVYICFMGYITIKRIKKLKEGTLERDYFAKLAYLDILTGGNNRTAYYRDLEQLNLDENEVFIALFDINELKYINDNYGHKYGDDAIREGYLIINRCFQQIGTCYRIGGDEFACLMVNTKFDEIKIAMNHLTEQAKNHDAQCQYPFAIACGIAKHDAEQDEKFDNSYARADANMYCDKKQIKSFRTTNCK